MSDEEEFVRPVRRPARFQISENVLFNAGVDRPTVEAFRHLLNMVGNTGDTQSLPAAVIGLESLELAPVFAPFIPTVDDLAPLVQMVEQVEFLQTEVRQLAEQVAILTNQINDLKLGITP